MSKVIIAGSAAVIVSDYSLETLGDVQKYRPKALQLMGGEDGKEVEFAVGVVKGGCGNINRYGASFGQETHDEDKKACITMCLDGVTGDVKDYIADKIGAAILSLNKIEAGIPQVLEEIAAEKATILENITLL